MSEAPFVTGYYRITSRLGTIVRDLIRKDKEAVRLWTKAVKRAGGGLPGNKNAAKSKTTLYNIQGRSEPVTPKAPSGTSPEAAIRRLETETAA